MSPEDRARKVARDQMFREMMRDRRVSDAARVLGAEIYLRGKAADGSWFHEISHRDFAAINSGKADDETIRRRLAQLRAHGYITSHHNGRRNRLYEFAPATEQGTTRVEPTTEQGITPVDPAPEPDSKPVSPHTPAGVNFGPASEQGSNPGLGGGFIGGENPCPSEAFTEGDDVDEGGCVDERAGRAIIAGADTLGPAADALRCYLPGHVAPRQQQAYVRSVLGVLEGLGTFRWASEDGTAVPREKWPAIVAEALDELATGEGQRNDAGQPAYNRPVGSFDNLRTKLGNLLNPPIRSRPAAPKPGTEAARVAEKPRGETPGGTRHLHASPGQLQPIAEVIPPAVREAAAAVDEWMADPKNRPQLRHLVRRASRDVPRTIPRPNRRRLVDSALRRYVAEQKLSTVAGIRP